MAAQLTIILRNPQPNRERQYPRSWLVYSSSVDPVKVHVEHNEFSSPQVVERKAV